MRGHAPDRALARHHDDAASACGAHRRQQFLGQPDRSEEVRREDLLPRRSSAALRGSRRRRRRRCARGRRGAPTVSRITRAARRDRVRVVEVEADADRGGDRRAPRRCAARSRSRPHRRASASPRPPSNPARWRCAAVARPSPRDAPVIDDAARLSHRPLRTGAPSAGAFDVGPCRIARSAIPTRCRGSTAPVARPPRRTRCGS